MNAIPTPRMTGTRVGGLAKFGFTPGGGCPAGSVFSMGVGRLAISFGLACSVEVDMMTINERADCVHNDNNLCGIRCSTGWIISIS